jgi:hypothetical protein
MKAYFSKRALTLVGVAATVYAGAFAALFVAHKDVASDKLARADAGMCPVPADAHQGPTYFVGCGGFF